jgi:hypothetical protein
VPPSAAYFDRVLDAGGLEPCPDRRGPRASRRAPLSSRRLRPSGGYLTQSGVPGRLRTACLGLETRTRSLGGRPWCREPIPPSVGAVVSRETGCGSALASPASRERRRSEGPPPLPGSTSDAYGEPFAPKQEHRSVKSVISFAGVTSVERLRGGLNLGRPGIPRRSVSRETSTPRIPSAAD